MFLHILPFGLLSLPIQNTPPGLVSRIDSRPLPAFLKVNSTASPSFRLRKPSMYSLLWCTKTPTGGRERPLRGRSWTGSQTPGASWATYRCSSCGSSARWAALSGASSSGALAAATCELLVWHRAHGSLLSPRPRAPAPVAAGPREVRRRRGGSGKRQLHLPQLCPRFDWFIWFIFWMLSCSSCLYILEISPCQLHCLQIFSFNP